MPTFAQYQAFVATVELRSLAKAARELNVSPSAISKQLSSLERDLGVALVERNRLAVVATESGKVFYERCKSILSAAREAESAAVAARDEMNGVLRLSVATPLAQSVLPATLAKFCDLYPHVRLEIRSSDEVDDLIAEQIDFAFRLDALADNRLRALRLFDIHPLFCAAPSYLEKHGHPEHLEELPQHRLIVLSTINLSAATKHLLGMKGRLSLDAKRFDQTNDVGVLYAAVRAGLGIGVLLDICAEEEIRMGKLVPLFPKTTLQTKQLSLVYAKRGALPKRLALFKDFVKANFRRGG